MDTFSCPAAHSHCDVIGRADGGCGRGRGAVGVGGAFLASGRSASVQGACLAGGVHNSKGRCRGNYYTAKGNTSKTIYYVATLNILLG